MRQIADKEQWFLGDRLFLRGVTKEGLCVFILQRLIDRFSRAEQQIVCQTTPLRELVHILLT